jgi:hypothetical protein
MVCSARVGAHLGELLAHSLAACFSEQIFVVVRLIVSRSKVNTTAREGGRIKSPEATGPWMVQ